MLDRAAIDLYLVTPVNQALNAPLSLQTSLTIDGVQVFSTGGALEAAVDVPIAPTPAGNGRIGVIRFAFDNLLDALEANGIANEPGTAHTLTFTAINTYWGDENTVFLYDEADVPSGVSFNPATLADHTVIDTATE